MSKTSNGNYFEDFSIGQVIRHSTPRTITAGDQALYIALTGSRFLLHSSAPDSKRAGFADLLVDDLLAFHIAFGKTVNDISLNAVANLGYADVRFLQPVYYGDTLRSESEIIGLKENSSGSSGIVYVRSTSRNQKDELVFSWVRWVMVSKNDLTAGAPETLIPDLPSFVSANKLVVPSQMSFANLDYEASGSRHRWDDYQSGEIINHIDGITIDDSDHTLATKLYQNNAKVHFDAHRMRESQFGKRLVYGGHIISLARSLSHNGLANALKIAAINGGSHVNPSFAGDTIYASTAIVDKWAVPERSDLGILRLRTLASKNQIPAPQEFPIASKNGRVEYDSNTVLDLDYSVLVAN